jgi:tRNA(His) 5'-end guanylyltransferase
MSSIAQSKDDLGDRMKGYENHETGRRFIPMLPVYGRFDGIGFSKFTKGMARPFDQRMTDTMVEVTKYLVKETHARIGYVQSDEISLFWHAEDHLSSLRHDGKVMKSATTVAAKASAKMGQLIRGWEPFEDRLPAFDGRVLQLPNRGEVANMFLWRNIDATKNAVSMAARHYYSTKELFKKNQGEMITMLAEKGVTFDDYPKAFRQGTWVRRVTEQRTLTDDELAKIPAKHRPNASELVTRSEVKILDVPPFRDIFNRAGFLYGEDAY